MRCVLDALDAAGARAMAALDAFEGRPAGEIAEGFLALWRAILERSEFRAGCAVVAVTVAAEEPALLQKAASVFRGWRNRLADLLARGGVPEARAKSLAATLVSAAEGAVVLARAEGSFEPFDLVAAEQIAAVRAARKP